jgi:hypothetical protein
MQKPRILLFVSKESATYQFTKRQVELACSRAVGKDAVEIEIIDIADRPDLAEQHNIEALPTIIVGGKRYVGMPGPDVLTTCLGIAPPPAGAANGS